ncbi:hypothetical protein SAMN05660816_01640 [Niastella yeongjuensis]|nr:hypothetical protein SAMN05660816_01640 [Niastella yeongjuensis]
MKNTALIFAGLIACLTPCAQDPARKVTSPAGYIAGKEMPLKWQTW